MNLTKKFGPMKKNDRRLLYLPTDCLVPNPLQPRQTFDEEELKTALREKLLPFQIPKTILMVDEIPRMENQKINRRKLGEQWDVSGIIEHNG